MSHPIPHPDSTRSRPARCIAAAALVLLLLGMTTAPAGRPPAASAPSSGPSGSGARGTPGAVPAYRKAETVAVLKVEGPIDGFTLYSLERRVARAKQDGCDAVVIDLDTPGGDLLATLDICHLLKTDAPANSVAWVNPRAYSAGTIIALNCREIVAHPNAAMGDAAPIQVTPVGIVPMPATERAKQEGPLRQLLQAAARRNGYDENLVQAFVRIGVELWLLEHRATGERIFVTADEYQAAFGQAPPSELPPFEPAPNLTGGAGNVAPAFRDLFQIPDESPETPQDAERRRQFEATMKPARATLTPDDAANWRLVAQVVGNNELLTISAGEAQAFGLVRGIVSNEDQLRAFFGATTIVRYDSTWSESLVRFLVSWPVRALLIVVFLVSLFVELAAPGVGVFGAAALVCALLLLGAPMLVGMADWWEVVLILLGLLLVAAELFVIPGFGVAGVAGIGCLLVGLVGTFISNDLSSAQGQADLWTGLTTTVFAGLVAIAIMWIITKNLDHIPVLNRVVLSAELRTSGAPESLLAAMGASTAAPTSGLAVGDEGTTATPLRPAGRATFNGRLLDVQSVGSFVEPGVRVRVVSISRFVTEVEEVEG